MISVSVDELFVSWLAAQLPGVNVSSERPGNVETVLPAVVVRRGASGDLDRWLDGPQMDVDCYAATRSLAGDLGRAVDYQFRVNTPAAWMGAQFSFLRCVQAPIKVPDVNQAVRHVASRYSFSLI